MRTVPPNGWLLDAKHILSKHGVAENALHARPDQPCDIVVVVALIVTPIMKMYGYFHVLYAVRELRLQASSPIVKSSECYLDGTMTACLREAKCCVAIVWSGSFSTGLMAGSKQTRISSFVAGRGELHFVKSKVIS